MSSWQPLLWLGVSGGWGEGERAQWTSVLEPLEDALYWAGRQSQEKHVPGPAPGRSLAVMDRDLFICAAGNFQAAPLPYSTYSLGAAVRSAKHTQHREVQAYRPCGLPRVPSASQGKADDTWNSNRSTETH